MTPINQITVTEHMLCEPKAAEFVAQVSKEHFLPKHLFRKDVSGSVFVGLRLEEMPIGFAYGSSEGNGGVFVLRFLYIMKEHRNQSSSEVLVSAIFRITLAVNKSKGALWRFATDDNENDDGLDARRRLVNEIPFCSISDVRYSKILKIKTEDISQIRKYKVFKPMRWKEKGYSLCNRYECNTDLINFIKNREQSEGNGEGYLSPFEEQAGTGFVIDKGNSFVLARENGRIPVGWIVCCAKSDEEVVIKALYIYPNERTRLIGHSFAAYALDSISRKYKFLSFDVAEGNKQMERMVKKYFAPLAISNQLFCSLLIEFDSSKLNARR